MQPQTGQADALADFEHRKNQLTVSRPPLLFESVVHGIKYIRIQPSAFHLAKMTSSERALDGDDSSYVRPPHCFDHDDRHGALRTSASVDDCSKPSPFDNRKPSNIQ